MSINADIAQQLVLTSIAPRITIDGLERPTSNALGKPIASTPDGLAAFWKWFGHSKTVDAEGRPSVYFHGTGARFASFRPSKTGFYGGGIYFSSDAESAEEFGDNHNDGDAETILMEVYIKADNPYIYTAPDAFHEQTNVSLARELLGTGEPFLNLIRVLNSRSIAQHTDLWPNPSDQFQIKLLQMGHDALVIDTYLDPAEWIVYDATNIKSVHNFCAFVDDESAEVEEVSHESSRF
jgi:hypothetical protein